MGLVERVERAFVRDLAAERERALVEMTSPPPLQPSPELQAVYRRQHAAWMTLKAEGGA